MHTIKVFLTLETVDQVKNVENRVSCKKNQSSKHWDMLYLINRGFKICFKL